MRAFQANIQALQSQAATILRNAKTACVQDSDGALQPVVDLQALQADLQALICEVRDWIAKFWKFPIQSKTNKDEKKLASRLQKKKDEFTAAQ